METQMEKYIVEANTYTVWNNDTNEEIDQDEQFKTVSINLVSIIYDEDCDSYEPNGILEFLKDKDLNAPNVSFERVDFLDQMEYEMFDTLKEAQEFYNSIQ